MGMCSNCIKNNKNYARSEGEKEILLFSYTSEADKEFQQLETKYNLLRDIDFQDYMYSLVQFDMENATLKDDYSNRTRSIILKIRFLKSR